MLLSRLAETSAAVAATSSRNEKSQLLVEVIADLEPDEIDPAIGFLTGSARQGRVGVGWATVSKADLMGQAAALTSSLTIADLDELISEVEVTTGPGSEQRRKDLIAEFLSAATGDEQTFARQILIGDLRQGALAGVVTGAVAKAAGVKLTLMRRAVMLSGDLGVAARIALLEGSEALEAITLEAGRPILPMLASTAADVEEALEATGPASVEWKLDGARIQVHRTDDDVAIYTRNLNDVTERLQMVVKAVAALDCRSVVLDGEVLGLLEDETPQAFQHTMSELGRESPGESPEQSRQRVSMRPFFFDIMLLDDEALIDRPLSERRAALERLAPDLCVPAVATADHEVGAAQLADSLATGHEGVMVKSLDGQYEAGRRGKSWRKVKPVYTLDLVVLAAEWGHGRRRGWLSNLHLGARDPNSDDFIMVGKTFKGLTDELLGWQTEAFLERKVRETQHTVYVRPELVVEIALDGAQSSTRYPGGVALRFARVRGYRPDREPSTADDIEAVRALLHGS